MKKKRWRCQESKHLIVQVDERARAGGRKDKWESVELLYTRFVSAVVSLPSLASTLALWCNPPCECFCTGRWTGSSPAAVNQTQGALANVAPPMMTPLDFLLSLKKNHLDFVRRKQPHLDHSHPHADSQDHADVREEPALHAGGATLRTDRGGASRRWEESYRTGESREGDVPRHRRASRASGPRRSRCRRRFRWRGRCSGRSRGRAAWSC